MLLQESSTANSSQATSPQRNLSLNLSQVAARLPLKSGGGTCDERTRLLGGRTPPRARRQNSENNNSFAINNNNNDNEQYIDAGAGAGRGAASGETGCGGGGGGVCADDDAQSEEATDVAVTADSDASEKQLPARQTTKKQKLSKLGSKTTGLKRVSFGSSKGSMVETLVFETPTPLAEHAEPIFGFECDPIFKTPTNYNTYSKTNMDDSGIEVQEESERSIVRVSIYQSSQPQQICPPEHLTKYEDNLDNSFSSYNNYNLEDVMTTVSAIPGYDRQLSTDSGWDNPFRPGGDLSREADEIVNMIRGGKPITPTEDHSLINGKTQREDNCNGTAAVEHVTKSNLTQTQSAQNGTNSHRTQSTVTSTTTTSVTTTAKQPENNGVTSLAQVSKQVVPGPTSASHVVIDEKKNKKKGCCTIQ